MSALAAPSTANASSVCDTIGQIEGHVSAIEKAIVSKQIEQMRAVAEAVGVPVPGGAKNASEAVLLYALQTEEGSLRTLLWGTNIACQKDKEAERAKQAAEEAKKAAEEAKQHAAQLLAHAKKHICYKKHWGLKFYYIC